MYRRNASASSAARSNPRVTKYEYLLVLQGYYQGWEDLIAVQKKGSGFDIDANREMKALLKDYRNNAPNTVYRVINRKEVRSNPRSSGQTYNGHPSRAHWNVALWVANDYGLYQAVSRMGKAEAVEFLMDRFPRTPDGVKMTKTLAAYAWRSLKD